MSWELSSKQTWLHHVNPSIKLILLVVVFVGLLLIDYIHFHLYFVIGLSFIYFFMTGYSYKWLLLFTLPFIVIFISSFTSMAFFGEGDKTLYQFGLFHITEESLYRGLHLGIRSIIFGLLGLIFALTTKPVSLFYSTMQQYKLKPKIAYSFMAAIRLLPMIAEEVNTLRQAMKVRGVTFSHTISGIYERIRYYAVPILAQSIRRAHRMSIAMEAKQFNGNRGRTYYYQIKYGREDLFFCILLICGITVCYYLQTNFSFLPVERVLH
ncbi:energy-coupling factor transport system permease protein [Gracilibacillus ureilyticus]|uniref:Energy-coupling factor transport system permease protein n=1 Tax=Gracilibacillus ureilyticus TaxID=531814 RepID=A0A1H9LIT9_9BACI|nr:energy-coupling factor transporter transmembrane component T [Gracilibacillus ureilyticus]SER11149.1 energy-coupling factor transport system permease protein [Gracilibacillus ureilyticus]